MRKFITKLQPFKIDILFNIVGLLIICVFFLPLFFPQPALFVTPEMGISDIWHFNLPVKSIMADALQNHYFPWWTSSIGTGFPILAESQMGFFNGFLLVLYSIFPFTIAFNIEYVLIFYCAFLGMYLFLRHIKTSSIASFIGAFAFTFSGFFISHIYHQNMMLAACYIPWAFLVVDLLFTTKKIRYILCALLIFSQQLFAGYMQIAFITWIFLGLYILVDKYVHSQKKNTSKSIWRIVLLSALIAGALLISAIQVVPTIELINHSIRKNGLTPSENIQYSYPLKHIITFLDPFLLGNPRMGTYPHYNQFDGSIFWENTGYIGIIPLVLALYAIIKFRKNKKIIVFTLLGLAAFLLMTGKHSPLYFIHTIPPFNRFRIPSRYIIMLIFSLCALAAIGFDEVYEQLKTRLSLKNKTQLIVMLLGVLSIINIFYVWNGYHITGPATDWLQNPETAQYISGAKKDGRIFSTIGSSFWYQYIQKSKREAGSDYFYYRNGLPHNYNILTGIDSFDAYVGKVNTNRQIAYTSVVWAGIAKKNIRELNIATESARLLGLASVRYVIVPEEIDSTAFTKKFTTKRIPKGLAAYNVYENSYFLPRAHIVYDYAVAKTLQSIQESLLVSTFEPQKTAVLEESVATKFSQKCAQDASACPSTIKIVKDSDHAVEIHTQTSAAGLLVLADSYYPGWHAYIDNTETKILPANLNQRAVVLPKGKHVVRFEYRANNFFPLLFFSGLGYLAIISLLVFDLRTSFLDTISRKLRLSSRL